MAGGSFGDDFLDSGVGFLPGQSVGDIISNGINGFGFNLIFANGAQAMWRELDPAFKSSISSVLGNIVDTVITAAGQLGLNDGGLIDRMLSIIPTLGDTSTYQMNGMFGAVGGGLLSFKDKSGKEIAEELEAVFSSVGDQMAAAALPALVPFQQVGEGMFETLIRVTSGIERAEYALERYGIEAINYADIVRKSGDVATEIIRQSVLALEPAASGVAQIIRDFTGEFEDLLDTYDQLMGVRALLRDIGSDDMALGVGQVRGAGGLDALASGIESFRDAFFTEQEQVDAAWARMAEQFAIINQVMPTTNEGFRALALGIDQSTREGAELFGRLMSLAEGFADVTARADDLAAAQRELQQAELDRIAAIEKAHFDSWNNVKRAVDGIAADFMDPSQLRQYRAERIRDQLAESGLDISVQDILGADKAQFRQAFEYLFALGTDEGRNQAAALADVWASFKQLLPAEEDAAKAAEELAKALRAATDAAYAQLQRAVEAEKAALQAAFNERIAAAQEAAKVRIEAAQARVSAITEIFNALDSAISSTRVESEELTRARRDAARGVLADAAAGARAGASLTGFSGLESALDAVAQPSEDLYETFEQYAVDQARTASDIYTLRETAAAQKSYAEMTLDAIQRASDAQLKAMRDQHEADLAALDQTLEYWRQQIDWTRGTYNATVSVGQAISSLASAIAAEAASRAKVDGSHAMGLASVPRDGYIAELHAGERILTKKDNDIFNRGDWLRTPASADAGSAALLAQVLDEIRAGNRQQYSDNGDMKLYQRDIRDTLSRASPTGEGFVVMTPAEAEKQ